MYDIIIDNSSFMEFYGDGMDDAYWENEQVETYFSSRYGIGEPSYNPHGFINLPFKITFKEAIEGIQKEIDLMSEMILQAVEESDELQEEIEELQELQDRLYYDIKEDLEFQFNLNSRKFRKKISGV